jgi:hypothetical protein
MIECGLVPVKKSQLHRRVIKYIGKCKSDMRPGLGAGRPEIMPISDLKRKFFIHQD